MRTCKAITPLIFIIFFLTLLSSNELFAVSKDTTALKRRLVISAGIGDASIIRIENWYNNTYKNGGDQKVVPQINPIYAKIEYRITHHVGIGVDLSYDDYEARQALPFSTTFVPVYKGYTFVGDVRLNKHFHLFNKRLDLYFGAGLGYEIQSISNIIQTQKLPTPGGNGLTFELTIGARAYITKRIGIYVEGGIARSILQGGLCIRL